MPESPAASPLVGSGADPLASLRCQEIEVEFGGCLFLIPALPAIAYLDVLLEAQVDAERIFPGLAGAEAVELVDELLVGNVVTFDELRDTALDVIGAASGRPWWFTLRLCATVRAAWDRLGGSVAGVDITNRPLGVWLDAAYAMLLSLVDPEKVGQLSGQLTMPPAGWLPEFDEQAESQAFLAMMAQSQNME